MNTPWLERELQRQLAPVTAPESLWYRIQAPRRNARQSAAFRWTVRAAVALLAFVVSAGAYRALSLRGNEKLTPQDLMELAQSSKDFDFRSDDFAAIRSFVKAEANIDIDVPDPSAATEHTPVQVVGVRLLRLHGLPIAAIDCQFGNNHATLLVSGKHPGIENNRVGKHLFSGATFSGHTRLVSWNMRNQNYALALPGTGDVHGACLLCHANRPALLTIN